MNLKRKNSNLKRFQISMKDQKLKLESIEKRKQSLLKN